MSDLITPAAYSDKSTSYETTQATLDDFRKLTLNRNKNLGSLVVNGKGGLKCADHHVFRPLNGFGSVKPEDARRVRAVFVDAVTKELASRFDLLIKSEQMRNPENVEALKKKIGELNKLISDMFLDSGNDNPRSSAFAPLERKDVKSFIENIELLEKNATSERLLKMNAAKLLNLSDRVNRQEAEKYENQSWDQLSSIISNGVPPEEKARTNAKKAYDNAVKAMKAANLEDLKKVGQDFLRATFPKIWEGDDSEKFKAFNAAFDEKGASFVYLDEKGDLTFCEPANETEIRSHYEQLIEAVAHMEEAVANMEFEQVDPEELGGVPTKETIAKALNDFADKLNTAKSEAEKAVAAAQEEAQKKELSEKLGKALGNVTDREILRKATNAVLHRCDSMLVNLSEVRRGVGNVNVKMAEKSCKGKFERAFYVGGIDSFHMNDKCELELEKGASIDTIKKDVGRLLAAIIDHNIVINGSDSGKQDRLREFLCCNQNDKKALSPAVQEFVAELAGSKHDDYHPIPNDEVEVDKGGLGEEPPVEEKKDEGNKVEGENAGKPKYEGKFQTSLETINRLRSEGRAKVTEPLIPPEGDESHTSVEKNTTSSDKTEGPQGKSVLEQIEEELEKEEMAKNSAAQKTQVAKSEISQQTGVLGADLSVKNGENIKEEAQVGLKDATEVKLPEALKNSCTTTKNGVKSYKELIETQIKALKKSSKTHGYEFCKQYATVLQNLTNVDWVHGAAQKVSKTVNLEHCDAIDVMESLNLVDLERDPFVPCEKSQSADAARDFAELYKDKETGKLAPIYVMIFADGHYCLCGLPTGWTTQEERTTGASDCQNVAWLMENDFVKLDIKKDQIRFAYTGKDGLTTTKGGYAINGVVNGVNARMGFSSMVSLTKESASYDIKGNADWMSWATGTTTEAEHSNQMRFITELYAMNDSKELKNLLEKEFKLKYDQNTFALIMKAAVFAKRYNLYCQSKGGSNENVKQEVTKMLRYLCANLAAKKTSKEFEAFKEEIERKYQESLMVGLCRQFVASVEFGAPVAIGGPIGAGAFKNDPKIIAKSSALGFFLTGGKTDYGFPVYNLDTAKTFRKAFVAVPMVLKAMKAKLGVKAMPGSADDKAITRMLIEKYKAEFDKLYDAAVEAIDKGRVYDGVKTVDGLKDQNLLQKSRKLATKAVEKAIKGMVLKMNG